MAAYRLVPGRYGEPVIAELRIFPLERTKGRPPGRWSGEVLGIAANIPEGGISADVVRNVSVGVHRQVGREFSRWLKEAPLSRTALERALATVKKVETFKAHVVVESPPEPKRGRPPIRSEKFYAKLAREYAERVAEGSPRPTADVARRRKLPTPKVRDMLHEARRRGLLSPTGQGRPGGELTAKALDILKAWRNQ